MLAVEAEWLKALEAFFAVNPSTLEPSEIEASFEHPIIRYALSLLDLPPASDSKGRGGYANAEMFYAIVTGRVETVEIMARHMELNIGDMLGEALLHYVYLVNHPEKRKKIVEIVVPKLKNYRLINMCKAAEYGDLESTKRFIGNLKPKIVTSLVLLLGGHRKWPQ